MTICPVHVHPVLNAQRPQVTDQYISRAWRALLAHESWHAFCSYTGTHAPGLSLGRAGIYHAEGTGKHMID
jgi:hypothetical protein